MKTTMVVAAIFIAACGQASQQQATTAVASAEPIKFDYYAVDGLRFKNELQHFDQASFDILIDEPFHQVEACIGALVDGPAVVIVPDGSLPNGWNGMTTSEPDLIRVDNTHARDGTSASSIVRHEYVHYVLRLTGFNPDDNEHHRSPFFAQCSGIGGS